MLANNLNEVLTNFDFTDSIVTEIRWADNLTDLLVTIDYYWDIQEGKVNTRLLNLIFQNCVKAEFQIGKKLPFLSDEINKDSLFTIILFKHSSNRTSINDKRKFLEIFTLDYENPWLSLICGEVLLEEKNAHDINILDRSKKLYG